MNIEEVIQVLHRLFRAYEWLDQAISKALIRQEHVDPIIRILRHLSYEGWRAFLGDSLARPAHARYVLRWCLKNVEVLRDAQLLSGQDHYAIAIEILADLEKLPPSDPGYSFGHDGGEGRIPEMLRQLYLTHNLHMRLHRLVATRRIDPVLFRSVRSNIFSRAREIFTEALGEAYESVDPGRSLLQALEDAESRRLVGREHYLFLKTLVQRVEAVRVAGGAGDAGDPEATRDVQGVLDQMAAVHELWERVTQNPYLPPAERDLHEASLQIALRSLVGSLARTPREATVDAVAGRLGIRLPLSASDSASLESKDLVQGGAEETLTDDAISGNWARELVREARG